MRIGAGSGLGLCAFEGEAVMAEKPWAYWHQITEERQLSEAEAIEIHDSGCWKEATEQELGMTQLTQERLFCPFGEFHKAAEVVLGRPVWSHEFADRDRLLDEYSGKRPKATLAEIMGLFPKHVKVIPVVID